MRVEEIPRHQIHKLIRDYPTGPTHQNEDHTSFSPHTNVDATPLCDVVVTVSYIGVIM